MVGALDEQKIPGLVLPYGRERGERAFQDWSETVSTIFDLDTDREAVRDFRFGFSAWHFGSLVLGVSRSDKISFRRAPLTVARTSIDHYLVQIYQTKALGAVTEGRDVEVKSGDISILDLARTVDIHETSFRSVNLAIPRTLLAPLLKDPDGLHGLKLSGDSPLGALLSRYLVDLSTQTARMTMKEAMAVAQSTVHLIAGCVGPAVEARGLAREGFAHARLAAIRTYIDAELANPALGVEAICRDLGISRAALYRLFEPFGGVHAHIRRRRLSRCFREIVNPGKKRGSIAETAFRWGFGDERSFNRSFREMYGTSPSEAGAAGAEYFTRLAEANFSSDALESRLGHWIVDLMKF